MSGFTAVLQGLRHLDGVLGVVVLDKAGEVVAEDLETSVRLEVMLSHLRKFIPSLEDLAEELEVGQVERHHVVLDDKQLVIENLADGAVLAVYTVSDGSNLGRIRLEIRKNRKNMEAALKA
ncbi:MAG: roadblock/LC7 domain-containing protein [bacterium]|nr:roadblock/LC7 domain-containing protein [bacterium]